MFRNFVLPFIWFLLGCVFASYPWLRRNVLYLVFLIGFVTIGFGFVVDYVGGEYFWREVFPTGFIASLKNSPVVLGGLFGNKMSYIEGKLYYRLSGLFVQPQHFSYVSVVMVFLSFLFNFPVFLTIFFLFMVVLSLVKSAYLYLFIAFLSYKLLQSKRKLLSFLKGGSIRVLFFFAVILLFAFLVVLSTRALIPRSTIGAHIVSAMTVFQLSGESLFFGSPIVGIGRVSSTSTTREFSLLQSDSGLSSLIFSIGILGCSLFLVTYSTIISVLAARPERHAVGALSLLVGWGAMLPFTSASFSPVGSAVVFFFAGTCLDHLTSKYVTWVGGSR